MNTLDELLAKAREAVPDPLDDEAIDALVSAALGASAVPKSRLDRVVAAARGAEPEPIRDEDVRRLAAHAAMTGGARHRRSTLRRIVLLTGAAAALAAAMTTLAVVPRTVDREVADTEPRSVTEEAISPTEIELSTGDRVVAAAGARFYVEVPEANRRSVRLNEGTMLFDVRHVEGGSFSVTTPNARVVVIGTIFTLTASAAGTTVRVYEGRVELRGHGRVRVIAAGGGAHLGRGDSVRDVLRERGEAAARERLATARPALSRGVDEAPSSPQNVHAPLPARRVRVVARETTRVGVEPQPSDPNDPGAVGQSDRSYSEARALIAAGHPEQALTIARRATRAGDVDPWRMLEGDALRALGRLSEAAVVYGIAARELPPPRRQQAGFIEARLQAGGLAAPLEALRALRDADVNIIGSPLRERGLSLEARVLSDLGREAERAAVARMYLADYPEGPRVEAMRAYLRLHIGAR